MSCLLFTFHFIYDLFIECWSLMFLLIRYKQLGNLTLIALRACFSSIGSLGSDSRVQWLVPYGSSGQSKYYKWNPYFGPCMMILCITLSVIKFLSHLTSLFHKGIILKKVTYCFSQNFPSLYTFVLKITQKLGINKLSQFIKSLPRLQNVQGNEGRRGKNLLP